MDRLGPEPELVAPNEKQVSPDPKSLLRHGPQIVLRPNLGSARSKQLFEKKFKAKQVRKIHNKVHYMGDGKFPIHGWVKNPKGYAQERRIQGAPIAAQQSMP